MVAFLISGCIFSGFEPETNNPQKFEIGGVEFMMPGNWTRGSYFGENNGMKYGSLRAPHQKIKKRAFILGIKVWRNLEVQDIEQFNLEEISKRLTKHKIKSSKKVSCNYTISDSEIECYEILSYQDDYNVITESLYLYIKIKKGNTIILVTYGGDLDHYTINKIGLKLVLETLSL